MQIWTPYPKALDPLLHYMNLRRQGNQSDIDDKTNQNNDPFNDRDNCHGLEDLNKIDYFIPSLYVFCQILIKSPWPFHTEAQGHLQI